MHASAELGDDYLRKIVKEMSEAPYVNTLNTKSDSIMAALRRAVEGEIKKDAEK